MHDRQVPSRLNCGHLLAVTLDFRQRLVDLPPVSCYVTQLVQGDHGQSSDLPGAYQPLLKGMSYTQGTPKRKTYAERQAEPEGRISSNDLSTILKARKQAAAEGNSLNIAALASRYTTICPTNLSNTCILCRNSCRLFRCGPFSIKCAEPDYQNILNNIENVHAWTACLTMYV